MHRGALEVPGPGSVYFSSHGPFGSFGSLLDVKNSWLMGDENPRKVWIEAAEKMSLFAGERVD